MQCRKRKTKTTIAPWKYLNDINRSGERILERETLWPSKHLLKRLFSSLSCTLNEVPPSPSTDLLNLVLKYVNAKHDRDIDDCLLVIECLKQKKRTQFALLDSALAYISYERH